MTEVLLPILTQAITHQLQYARSQVRPFASRGEDEEPTVLSNQVSALGELSGVPPEKAFAELKVQGCGAERQQGELLATVESDVAKNLPDRLGIVQVMLTLHIAVKGLPLLAGDEPHDYLFKEPIFRRQPGNWVLAITVGHPPIQS